MGLKGVELTVQSFHTSNRREASAKDPYEVLGVKKDSKASDIKKSYYQVCLSLQLITETHGEKRLTEA